MNHIFIFGGPRNGSWHYQFVRTSQEPMLYSGLKEVDWKSDNYRNFNGDVHHGTVFRAGTDDIYKKLTLEDHSQPSNFFEACCLQSPETFFDNVNYIEDSGYRLCVKGYEQAVGLAEAVDHDKIYIHRPMKDQWRSYAIAYLTRRWQWEKDDSTPEMIEMNSVSKTEVCNRFMSRMYNAFDFYKRYRGDENFTELSFEQVSKLPAVSPLKPTPKLKLSDEVEEWISDTSPFDAQHTVSEDERPYSLNELENLLWPSSHS